MSADVCPKCGTDHDGYWPDECVGGVMACVRARAAAAGPDGADLLAEVDEFEARFRAHQLTALRRHFRS